MKAGSFLAGRRAIGRVPFPGAEDDPELEIGLRILTESEVDEARLDSADYLRRLCKARRFELERFIEADPEMLDREHQRAIVFRACVDPESDAADPAKFFDTPAQVRRLDTLTLQRLYEAYLDWQDCVDPRVSLSESDARELAETLKKEPEARVILTQFAPDTLRALVRSLALRLAS